MIKVLHIVPTLGIGGIENTLFNYFSNIDKKEFHWDFVVHGDEVGEIEKRILQMGAKVYHITPKHVSFMRYCSDLFSVLKNGEYDIIHAHQGLYSFFSLAIATLAGNKIRVGHSHNFIPYEKKLKLFLCHFLNRLFVTNRCACGKDAARWAFGDLDFLWIKNAVDIPKMMYSEKNRFVLQSKYNTTGKKVIGLVGRLSEEKNISFALDVFAKLIHESNNYILFIVGDGKEKQELQNKAVKLHINENVIFTGFSNECWKFYSFFDILLLPSKFEGFPVVLIEAQTSGLNAVVSKVVTDESIINSNIIKLDIGDENINDWVSAIKSFPDNNVRKFNTKLQMFEVHQLANELKEYYWLLLDSGSENKN